MIKKVVGKYWRGGGAGVSCGRETDVADPFGYRLPVNAILSGAYLVSGCYMYAIL